MKPKLLYDDVLGNSGELTPEGVEVSKKVYKTMRKLVKSLAKDASLKHLELMLMRAASSECSWESLEQYLKQTERSKKRGKK